MGSISLQQVSVGTVNQFENRRGLYVIFGVCRNTTVNIEIFNTKLLAYILFAIIIERVK